MPSALGVAVGYTLAVALAVPFWAWVYGSAAVGVARYGTSRAPDQREKLEQPSQ